MDSDLVTRAQQGDQQSFTALAHDAWERLYQLALRILRDEDMAEEAAEEALVTIWRKLPSVREPSRFEAWSYRLLVNTCASVARRRGRQRREISGHIRSEPGAPDAFDAVVDRDELERGFRRLSVDQRAVLVLHHYLDMPVERVAEVLDIPVGTVKSRLHRALAQMRIALRANLSPRSTAYREASR